MLLPHEGVHDPWNRCESLYSYYFALTLECRRSLIELRHLFVLLSSFMSLTCTAMKFYTLVYYTINVSMYFSQHAELLKDTNSCNLSRYIFWDAIRLTE